MAPRRPGACPVMPMKVLVMQQKMLGDVLTSSLLCENLKQRLPGVQVEFLAHEPARAVLQGNPHVDRLHAYAARSPWRVRRALGRRLRAERYDAVIDVYGKWESLALVRACQAGRSIGYRKWYTHALYSDPVPRVARAQHGLPLAIEHRLALLGPLLGTLDVGVLATRPRLYVAAEERAAARGFLDAHDLPRDRPLLMINALGSEPRKTYPLPAMARLIDRIASHSDAVLLFNCLPAQRTEAQALYALCAPATRLRIVLDAYPRGLREFIAVLAECDGLFGNEGGAVNMARALDVPSFSIFSPWISKAVWGSDDGEHPAVHLADFAAAMVDGRSTADLKRHATALYAAFRPEWIEPGLDRFLATLRAPVSA
jgi:heptosyltransferase II